MKQTMNNLLFYLRILWQKNKSYFWGFFSLVLAEALTVLIATVLPKVLLQGLLKQDVQRFFADFAVLTVLSCICAFVCAYYSVKNSDIFVGLGFRLKESIQQRALTMRFALTEDPVTLNKIKGALDAVDRFVPSIHQSGVKALSNGLILAAFFVWLISFQPLLLLLSLLNVAVNLMMQNRAKSYRYANKEKSIALNRKKDYVFGLMYDYRYGKEIRLYDLKGWLFSIYEYYKIQYCQLNQRLMRRHFTAAVVDLVFTVVRETSVYLYLIYLFTRGGLTIDAFVFYTGIMASFGAAGVSFAEAATDFADAIRNVDEYKRFLEADLMESFVDGEISDIDSFDIEFQDVSFRYPGSEKYVLRHFSYRIKSGRHIAVVGLNGAGKSTIIKLLCGLYDDYEGEITVGGRDIRNLSRAARLHIFAAVFQESQVLAATVLENITLTEEKMPDMTERAENALRQVGLYDKVMSLSQKLDTPVTRVLADNGIEFSGGEQQKLMLCRAIYKDSPVLILDEPTAALDALAENAVYENFHAISRGKTVLFISHRLNSTRFCDEVLLLKDGRVVEQGTHEALYECKGEYYRLFKLQAEQYLRSREQEESNMEEKHEEG